MTCVVGRDSFVCGFPRHHYYITARCLCQALPYGPFDESVVSVRSSGATVRVRAFAVADVDRSTGVVVDTRTIGATYIVRASAVTTNVRS
jgi:hypothetical protein